MSKVHENFLGNAKIADAEREKLEQIASNDNVVAIFPLANHSAGSFTDTPSGNVILLDPKTPIAAGIAYLSDDAFTHTSSVVLSGLDSATELSLSSLHSGSSRARKLKASVMRTSGQPARLNDFDEAGKDMSPWYQELGDGGRIALAVNETIDEDGAKHSEFLVVSTYTPKKLVKELRSEIAQNQELASRQMIGFESLEPVKRIMNISERTARRNLADFIATIQPSNANALVATSSDADVPTAVLAKYADHMMPALAEPSYSQTSGLIVAKSRGRLPAAMRAVVPESKHNVAMVCNHAAVAKSMAHALVVGAGPTGGYTVVRTKNPDSVGRNWNTDAAGAFPTSVGRAKTSAAARQDAAENGAQIKDIVKKTHVVHNAKPTEPADIAMCHRLHNGVYRNQSINDLIDASGSKPEKWVQKHYRTLLQLVPSTPECEKLRARAGEMKIMMW